MKTTLSKHDVHEDKKWEIVIGGWGGTKSVIRSSDEEWEVTSERCWHRCGQKGGKCSYCGENGYCCRNTHHPWNGDCPAEAIEITRTYGHDCVQKKEG